MGAASPTQTRHGYSAFAQPLLFEGSHPSDVARKRALVIEHGVVRLIACFQRVGSPAGEGMAFAMDFMAWA